MTKASLHRNSNQSHVGKAKTTQTDTNHGNKHARYRQAYIIPYTLICKHIHEVGAVKHCQGSILDLHNECLRASHIGIWTENSGTEFIASFHCTWQPVCEAEPTGKDHRLTECYWGLQKRETVWIFQSAFVCTKSSLPFSQVVRYRTTWKEESNVEKAP